ncbi:tetratricopeptide repeat protein [Rhodoplanes sp. Z2-YC6860]|uniref:tetratricopeptide repeat protein n=1 Tax=Rhodoplanes sp. Z2-YC6860 TaxID=674703 RepID=UPI000A028F5B|nr:tetratricopeptide repeat protein [Rhodoplanes sp. Z2-YC6860]
MSRMKVFVAIAIATAVLFVGGLAWLISKGPSLLASSQAARPATFVGSEVCAGCHKPEFDRWRTSQHQRAMDHATDQSVLGDFNNASFENHGVTSRFFRKDGKFFVETDGPDGQLATFQIKYTFGFDPLQQYLIEFPDGRLQALSVAWDSRPKDHGGQRWFHLYPNENIRHDDSLHWTKLNQNWNFMCAECHSTGVRKNYDAAKDRFATTWSEISVGCEACHGQGSRHVAWANDKSQWWRFGQTGDRDNGLLVRFDERRGVTWQQDPARQRPQRSVTPASLRKEVETCGLCHARRSQLSENWVPGRPLADTHQVTPLLRGLFHPDGQMRDEQETYNYAPFVQSKMFAMGVTCSDCHESHSAALRAPGNNVCGQCHSPEKYDDASHHHHADIRLPVSCASCHMPSHTYMGVDRRHDHSFRIPRPDISVKVGTSNACNDCHRDRPAEWAAAAVEGWFGLQREGFQKYAQAFHAGWTDQTDAANLLAIVASDTTGPDFVRASALGELGAHAPSIDIGLARSALSDRSPLVRVGALDMLEGGRADQLWPLASPLLSDPVRGVRLRAVSLLAAVPAANQPPADRQRFERVAAEFVAAQRLNADRPEARSTLGAFYARRGMFADAEMEYRAALRLNPQFAPAAVDLADLYRQLGRNEEGIEVLRTTIASAAQDAGLHHGLGLALVRAKRRTEALEELARAAELDPSSATYAYTYAVALHSAGRPDEAVRVLEQNLARHPSHSGTLTALIAFHRDSGDVKAALGYARRLAQLQPADRGLAALIDALEKQLGSPDKP